MISKSCLKKNSDFNPQKNFYSDSGKCISNLRKIKVYLYLF